jgi:hypothetical protein
MYIVEVMYLEKPKQLTIWNGEYCIKAQTNGCSRYTMRKRKWYASGLFFIGYATIVYNVWVGHVSTVHTTRAHLLIKASYHITDTSRTATPTESKVELFFAHAPTKECILQIYVICTQHKRKYMSHIYTLYMPMCQ